MGSVIKATENDYKGDATYRALEVEFPNGSRITALPANLQVMKALRTLSLSRCPIPDAEKVRIREALPTCHVIF